MAVELSAALDAMGHRYRLRLQNCQTVQDVLDLTGTPAKASATKKEDKDINIPAWLSKPMKAAMTNVQHTIYDTLMKTKYPDVLIFP